MTPSLRAGDAFPDFELPDHRKQPRRLSGYTRPSPLDERLGFDDGYPLILVFGRGSFCPRDGEQMRVLVRFQSELAVNSCKLVPSAPTPRWWAPRSVKGWERSDRFFRTKDGGHLLPGLLDETEGEYAGVSRPFTFVLRPELSIHRIYDG